MSAKLNNVLVPSPMCDRGVYRWDWPILSRNGLGTALRGPFATVTWEFAWLNATEYGFWATTLLGGDASAVFTTNTSLYNDAQVLTTIASCILLAPTYAAIQNAGYTSVKVTIDRIVIA